jgi:hypothetical protein
MALEIEGQISALLADMITGISTKVLSIDAPRLRGRASSSFVQE